MKTIINLALVYITVFCFASCAKDLPQPNPESEISRAISKVQAAEARAKIALEAARIERKKTEALLVEARRDCEKNIRICKLKCNESRVRHKKDSMKSDTQQDQKSSVPKDPEYSPSDAPEGWKSR